MESVAQTFSRRLITAAILGSVVAVAVLIVVVLRLGLHHPSPPSLEDDPRPDIPGEVVFVTENGCVNVAAASGTERRQVRCGMDWAAFAEPGVVEYGRYTPAQTAFRLELATLTETAITGGRPPKDFPGPQSAVSPRGEVADVDGHGDVFASSGTSRVRVYDCDCPDGYAPSVTTWSPDGDWILLTFYPRGGGAQLWIVKRDGSVAGTLAKGIRPYASWAIVGVGVSP